MNLLSKTVILSSLVVLSACEKQGPAERAGEKLDEAVQEARISAEQMAEEADDAMDGAREQANEVKRDAADAAEEIRRGVKDAADDLNGTE